MGYSAGYPAKAITIPTRADNTSTTITTNACFFMMLPSLSPCTPGNPRCNRSCCNYHKAPYTLGTARFRDSSCKSLISFSFCLSCHLHLCWCLGGQDSNLLCGCPVCGIIPHRVLPRIRVFPPRRRPDYLKSCFRGAASGFIRAEQILPWYLKFNHGGWCAIGFNRGALAHPNSLGLGSKRLDRGRV